MKNKELKDMGLTELLNILMVVSAINTEEAEKIVEIIVEKYDLKPKYQFEDALKDLEKLNLPEPTKQKIKIAKKCALDIIERLDVEHTNNIYLLEKLVAERIKVNKEISDI